MATRDLQHLISQWRAMRVLLQSASLEHPDLAGAVAWVMEWEMTLTLAGELQPHVSPVDAIILAGIEPQLTTIRAAAEHLSQRFDTDTTAEPIRVIYDGLHDIAQYSFLPAGDPLPQPKPLSPPPWIKTPPKPHR